MSMKIVAILSIKLLRSDIIYVYKYYRLFIIANNHIESRLHDSIQFRWLNVTQVFSKVAELLKVVTVQLNSMHISDNIF